MARQRIPTEHLTAARLHLLCTEQWRMPEEVAALALAAMMRSRYTRATEIRQYLAAALGVRQVGRPGDFRGLFTRESLRPLLAKFSPEFFVKLCEDVLAEGVLSRQQASQIQTALLRCTDQHGMWQRVPTCDG